MKAAPQFSVSLLVISLILFVAGCAAPVQEQERAGFISDYSKLSKTSSRSYLYTSPRVNEYTSFIVERPVALFTPDETGMNAFTDEEMEEILTYFQSELVEAISNDDKYQVVAEAGPGVARIRVCLTDMDATIGALNVNLATKMSGAGLGGAAMEGEMVDSVTGEQLGASIQWGSGSRVLRAGFTKMGDAKLQINGWAKMLRQRLDEAAES